MFAILSHTFENFYGQLRLGGICPTDIFPSSRSSDMGRSYGITFTFYYEQHPPSPSLLETSVLYFSSKRWTVSVDLEFEILAKYCDGMLVPILTDQY